MLIIPCHELAGEAKHDLKTHGIVEDSPNIYTHTAPKLGFWDVFNLPIHRKPPRIGYTSWCFPAWTRISPLAFLVLNFPPDTAGGDWLLHCALNAFDYSDILMNHCGYSQNNVFLKIAQSIQNALNKCSKKSDSQACTNTSFVFYIEHIFQALQQLWESWILVHREFKIVGESYSHHSRCGSRTHSICLWQNFSLLNISIGFC